MATFFASCGVIFSFSGKIVRNMAKMMTKRAYGNRNMFRCAAPRGWSWGYWVYRCCGALHLGLELGFGLQVFIDVSGALHLLSC